MGFNPFNEKGTPLEKQIKNWASVSVKPYNPKEVDPYTRTRGILMNGIEVEAVMFYHNFSRHVSNMELKQNLAMVRRIEQQEQKMVNWSIPASESVLEVTVGYEQLAVDLTAALAQNEPDPYVKAALDFALLEDFDHLYRYSNLLLNTENKQANAITKEYTEIMPARPTFAHHRNPNDTIRKNYDSKKASPVTKMNVATITAAEQQTMNYYMNVGNRIEDTTGRALYQEIGQVEEDHVTHYGSLADPTLSWHEMAVLHEYNECYLYYSCMQSEKDPVMKEMWSMCLENEIEHLHMVAGLLKKYENKDALELVPSEFPNILILKPAVDYVRNIISSQFDFTSDQSKFVPFKNSESKERFIEYQNIVNSGDLIPSQKVVAQTIQTNSQDYRQELKGLNPIPLLQRRNEVPSRESVYDSWKK